MSNEYDKIINDCEIATQTLKAAKNVLFDKDMVDSVRKELTKSHLRDTVNMLAGVIEKARELEKNVK